MVILTRIEKFTLLMSGDYTKPLLTTNYYNTFFMYRVIQAKQEGTPVVDVDGSYLYRKYKLLSEAGEHVSQPQPPSPPPPGWKVVNESTYKDIAPSIPIVTIGNDTLYKYCTN